MRSKKPAASVLAAQRHIMRHFSTGAMVLVPIFATVFVIKFLFDFLDGTLSDIARLFTAGQITIPVGAGIAATLVLIYGTGLFLRNYVGRRLAVLVDDSMKRLPLVSSIYTATRQIVESLVGPGNPSFKRVVIVDWPRPGIKSIGLLTGEIYLEEDKKMYTVYFPSSPIPTGGFLAVVPEGEIQESSLTVEEAMKLIISGGIAGAPEPRADVAGKRRFLRHLRRPKLLSKFRRGQR